MSPSEPIVVEAHDPDRKSPPGQIETRKWPLLHWGEVPSISTDDWRLDVHGTVTNQLSISYDELLDLPRVSLRCDMHCVTSWSRFDNRFSGVQALEIVGRTIPSEATVSVLAGCAGDYTTNLDLDDLTRPTTIIATHFEDEPLPPEHGGPVRLLVPHLYLWKSAKWLSSLEFRSREQLGFWEEQGYHRRGDPWKEERVARADAPRMRRGPRSGP